MRLLVAFVVVATAFAIAPAVASAPAPDVKAILAKTRPMRVTIVRSAEPGCEPDCAEWISAEGAIHTDTPAAFRKVFKTLGKRNLPLFIHSQGGAVDAAIAIGRMIRARGMDVAVTRTQFEGCELEAPDKPPCAAASGPSPRGTPVSLAYCASACPLILAGGVRRFAAPWTLVGVHQITTVMTHTTVQRTFRVTRRILPTQEVTEDRELIHETRTSRTETLKEPTLALQLSMHLYLIAMGVSDDLVDLMSKTPAASMHWMTRPEIFNTRLVSDAVGGEVLAALPARIPAAAVLSDGTKTYSGRVEWHFAKPGRDKVPTAQLFGTVRIEPARATVTASFIETTSPDLSRAYRLVVEPKIDPNPFGPDRPDMRAPYARIVVRGVSDPSGTMSGAASLDPFYVNGPTTLLSPTEFGRVVQAIRAGRRIDVALIAPGRYLSLAFGGGSSPAFGEALAEWGDGPPIPATPVPAIAAQPAPAAAAHLQ
jgi:hypothetical protein